MPPHHLFISYAWEDKPFATWLSTNLARRGYLVWIDQHKLLGGESFPENIEDAIEHRSFRLLALMSVSSNKKPNPRKERVLAEKVAKKKSISDFLIPLKVDHIDPNDFDITTTDRTAIDFSHNWAAGLAALIKKLEDVGCPLSTEKAHAGLREMAREVDLPISGEEEIFTNLLPINKLPRFLYGFKTEGSKKIGRTRIACKRDDIVWMLQRPKIKGKELRYIYRVEALGLEPRNGIVPRHILQNLLEKAITDVCIRNGLKFDNDDLYFPLGLLPKNKIAYPSPSGRKTWSLVSGVKTSGYSNGERRQFRYFTVPTFWVALDRFGKPAIRLGIRVRNTDMNQKPLSRKDAFRKRKKTTATWRNHQWLTKHLAIAHWLTDGKPLKLFDGDQTFEVGNSLVKARATNGVDELKIKAPVQVDVFDDQPEDGDDV